MAISSPGIGSNIDVNGIVSKLMAVESQSLTNLQKKEASYQAKLSAYGTVKGTLSSFQSAAAALSDATKFLARTATASDASVLTASTSSVAVPGSYSITINSLAQAQSISSTGQASSTAAIGTGAATTLTFEFGTISGASPVSGKYSGATFTQDATQATGTVTIDSSNNSLQGIRDAINAANVGVTASIVSDGDPTNPYHLLLTSNSTGATKSMKITSSGGDASITNLLSYNPAGTQNLTQTTAAQNASLSVNGLSITSASNSVTGAISGVTLNLTKAGTSSLTVANDTSAISTAMQSLVQAYNSTNTVLNAMTRVNKTTKQAGILVGDASVQAIQAQMRATMARSLSGLGNSTLTNLSQIGLSFLKDGTLTLDSAKLSSALSTNFNDFASLFAAYGRTTDSLTSYVSSTANSKPGSYDVEITTLATQGKSVGSDKATQAMLTGSLAANLNIGAGSNDQLLVSVDGGSAVSVKLTPGAPYASAADLATQVQTDINAALATAGQSGQVTVTESGGKLSIKSNSFGAASSVSVTDDPVFPANTGATDLLGTPTMSRVTTITAGVNDTLSMGVNGTTASITLAAGTYTASSLAAQIQSAFNGTSAFSSAGIAITVSQSADMLTVTSNRYGMTSAVSIAGGTAKTNLFGASPTSTLGTDVAGKIGGVTANGSGQFLTGATGSPSEGLKLQINGGATGARGTLNFSQGYAYNLNKYLDSVLGSSGTIAASIDGMNRTIEDLTKRADTLNIQLTAVEKRYRAQFTALDKAIGQMSVTASYLTQQLSALAKSS